MSNRTNHHPTERFSGVVANYIKYRPSYPTEVISTLREKCGLTRASIVADIGSGIGIFTKLLLEHGNKVFAVEPNSQMRQAAEDYLAEYQQFISVDASSEQSTLEQHSIDLITAAQAFHWFDQEKAKLEFKRILKPNGWVVLLWNLRKSKSSGIMEAYENLLQKFGTDYKQVYAEGVTETAIRQFFKPSPTQIIHIPYSQTVDWTAFKGRLLSTSYTPKPGADNFQDMLKYAKEIFDRHQKNNTVTLIYETKIYIGKLK